MRRGATVTNRSQSKYFATAARMDDAFLALLEKKDLAYITVKEICAAAGVNRSTFYLHYETIDDLLCESVEHVMREFLAHMGQDEGAFVANLAELPREELYLVTPRYLAPYLTYIKEHMRLFRTMTQKAAVFGLADSYEQLFRHVFVPILRRFSVPAADREYLMAFYIQGLMAIIAKWVEGGCADPVEHVAAVMQRCVGSGMAARL